MNINPNNIFLPVSLGEAIDKLTILDIKLENINDFRKNDVQIEYNLLYDELKQFIVKYNDLYQTMKKVNKTIWDMMDILRDKQVDNNTYLTVCKDCIEYNDVRFRVKNKINNISKSILKEQKSYKINRAIIEIIDQVVELNHRTLDPPNENAIKPSAFPLNLYDFIKPIKYFSFFYDEIIIVYNGGSELLKSEFEYDNTVHFVDTISEKMECKKHIIIPINSNIEEIYANFAITDEQINFIL